MFRPLDVVGVKDRMGTDSSKRGAEGSAPLPVPLHPDPESVNMDMLINMSMIDIPPRQR